MRKNFISVSSDHLFHGKIKEKIEKLAEKYQFNTVDNAIDLIRATQLNGVDFLLIDIDSISHKSMVLINDLICAGNTAPMFFISDEDSRILHAMVSYSREKGLNIVGTSSRCDISMRLDSILILMDESLEQNRKMRVFEDDELMISKRVLKRALRNNEITAYFQPLHYVRSGNIRGAEALARWPVSKHDFLPPSLFLKSLGKHGLMESFSTHILHHSLNFVKKVAGSRNLSKDFICGVNIPASVATSWSWLNSAISDVTRIGVSPENIVFEITEDGCDSNNEFLGGAIAHLRMKGFQCAIDDFGVGASTVSRLLAVPFNEMKIDRGILHAARSQNHAKEILKKTIAIAKDINALVVVEGVENEFDRSMIDAAHADVGQGFLYSPAITAENFMAYLKGKA